MNGPSFSLQKMLEAIRDEKPKSMVIGSHHFVQMSEMKLWKNDHGEQFLEGDYLDSYKRDLSSILWALPVGANVPDICFENLKNIFYNLSVYTLIN